MIALNAKGTSEFIEHVDYAEQVDSHNVLSKIKWIGKQHQATLTPIPLLRPPTYHVQDYEYR